jgi:hypothetical protein
LTNITKNIIAKAILLTFASIILLNLLIDYSAIHVWQHDSALYDLQGHFHKIFKEGRWLNPYMAVYFSKLGGPACLWISLASIFIFLYRVSSQYVDDRTYVIIFSLMCLQAIPWADQLMWPITAAPIFIILMISAFVSRSLPMCLFYPLFGALFFATSSNFYYLLPLVHIHLLNSDSLPKNIKFLVTNIIPYWILGFVLGYVSMKFMVFIFNYNAYGVGTTELNIADWRSGNPVEGIKDIVANTVKSANYLKQHLTLFFESYTSIVIVIVALGLRARYDQWKVNIPMLILCSAMIAAHYVLVIPFGFNIDVRTVVATWLGLLFFVFMINKINVQTEIFIMALMVVLSFLFYSQNKDVLKVYSTITNTYYQDLVKSTPIPPQQYEGILLLEDDETFAHLNQRIISENNYDSIRLSWGNNVFRWSPVAQQAGYKSVKACLYYASNDRNCIEALEKFSTRKSPTKPQNITIIEGELNNYLVVRFNRSAEFIKH